MSHISFRRKITAQSVLAFLLIIFGMALVMLALFMPPRGEIHPSVITVFGMLLVAAGAFLGIDLNFQFKSYLNSLQASAAANPAGTRPTSVFSRKGSPRTRPASNAARPASPDACPDFPDECAASQSLSVSAEAEAEDYTPNSNEAI